MPVSRKPKGQSEKKLAAFIEGSEGDVIQEKDRGEKPKSVGTKALKLRIPEDLLEEIDQLVNQRKPSPSRHQWILEALYEKVDREKPE